MGLSQEQMAQWCQYDHRRIVQKSEQDNTPIKPQEADRLQLSMPERLFLLRRRLGWSQKKLAPYVGVSRYWLSQMEIGAADCARLEEFWK